MTRIALVTAIAAAGVDDDLTPLLDACARAGLAVQVRAWDDATVGWYSLPFRLIGAALFFPMAASGALLPRLSTRTAKSSAPTILRSGARTAKASSSSRG